MTFFGSLQFGMEHNFLKSRPEKSASNYWLAVSARKNSATEAGRLYTWGDSVTERGLGFALDSYGMLVRVKSRPHGFGLFLLCVGLSFFF